MWADKFKNKFTGEKKGNILTAAIIGSLCVAATLDDYISDVDVAVGLLDKNDLASVENLQAYQARMKQLYGLEKFAFVDENGIIYTSRGTRHDIDQYDFDYNNISDPVITIRDSGGNDKKIIIAVPWTVWICAETLLSRALWK